MIRIVLLTFQICRVFLVFILVFVRKMLAQQVWLANSFVSLRELGTMIDSRNSWKCGPLDVFYVNSWIFFLCTSGPTDHVVHTCLYRIALHKHQDWWFVPGFWVLVTMAGHIAGMPAWPALHKSHECWDSVLFYSSPSRDILHMSLYFTTREKACIKSLCLTLLDSTQCISFAYCFYSAPVAVINFSLEYNLLLLSPYDEPWTWGILYPPKVYSNLILLWSENILHIWFQFFLKKTLRLVLWPKIRIFLLSVPCTLKKVCILLLLGILFYKYQLGQSG